MAKKNAPPPRPPRVYEADLASDFGEDRHNANVGTERGHAALEKSIGEFGAGRSMLADKEGRIIAGNKSRDALIAAGMTKAIVIETDGTTPVVVKRVDLDLKKKRARRLAYADNRVAELDLDWDPAVLAADQAEGLLEGFFSEKELENLCGGEGGGVGDDDQNENTGAEHANDITCPSCGETIRLKPAK